MPEFVVSIEVPVPGLTRDELEDLAVEVSERCAGDACGLVTGGTFDPPTLEVSLVMEAADPVELVRRLAGVEAIARG